MNVKFPEISAPDIGRVDLPSFDPGVVVDAAEVVVDGAGRGLSWLVDRVPLRDRRRPLLAYAAVGAGAVAAVVIATKLAKRRDQDATAERDNELRRVA